MAAIVTVATLLLAASAATAPPVAYHYRFDPERGHAYGRVCVAADAAEVGFVAPDAAAASRLVEAGRSSGAPLERRGRMLHARDWRAGECLQLEVDLRVESRDPRRELGYRAGDDLLLSPHTWLWRPESQARAPDAELTLEVPAGYAVSAPWQQLAAEPGRYRFRVGASPPGFAALVAVGRFGVREPPAGAGRVRLAVVGTPAARQRATLERFAAETVADVAALFPHAFAHEPQLVLIPVGAQRDPVPFGQNYRGGGSGVLLYVDPTRPLADYHGNWTLAHELLHPLQPYLGDSGRWIGEGIATYYQNVVRARAGRISARAAWAELDAGFGRGRAQRSALSLTETSRQMGRRGLYMRGYWSGTALALRADVAWRTRSAGKVSLADVLDRYAACCLRDATRMRAADYAAALDRLAGDAVLGPLLRAHADASAFPDLTDTYTTLGLRATDAGLEYDAAAVPSALRRAIMGAD